MNRTTRRVLVAGGLAVGVVAAVALVRQANQPPPRPRTLHVSPDRPGLTRSGDTLSLEEAARSVRSGDILDLAPGTYPGGSVLRDVDGVTIDGHGQAVVGAPAPGSEAPPFELRFAKATDGNDGQVFANVRNLTLKGVTWKGASRNGLWIDGGQGVTIRNCAMQGNGRAGILAGSVSGLVIDHCHSSGNGTGSDGHGLYLSGGACDGFQVTQSEFDHNRAAGIQVNSQEGGDRLISGALISGCSVHDNGLGDAGAALNLAGLVSSTLVNNLLVGNRSGGVVFWKGDAAGPSKSNLFAHNTEVFQPGQGRYGISCHDGSTGNRVLNCVFVCPSCPAVQAADPMQVDNSAITGQKGTAQFGSRVVFVDAKLGSDYHPAKSSPAIALGKPGLVSTDKDGKKRSGKPTAGCYE